MYTPVIAWRIRLPHQHIQPAAFSAPVGNWTAGVDEAFAWFSLPFAK
jgi:hypothetical protein